MRARARVDRDYTPRHTPCNSLSNRAERVQFVPCAEQFALLILVHAELRRLSALLPLSQWMKSDELSGTRSQRPMPRHIGRR